jgi:hypothetical protein
MFKEEKENGWGKEKIEEGDENVGIHVVSSFGSK